MTASCLDKYLTNDTATRYTSKAFVVYYVACLVIYRTFKREYWNILYYLIVPFILYVSSIKPSTWRLFFFE